MSQTPAPGFADQDRKRRVLRTLGFLLVGAGLAMGFVGVRGIIDSFQAMDDSGFGSLFVTAGGGFLVVIGLGLVNAGTLGAQARYVAGETMPVVKDSAAYLADGRGPAPASGPHCRGCGTHNDADARYCDSCGSALA